MHNLTPKYVQNLQICSMYFVKVRYFKREIGMAKQKVSIVIIFCLSVLISC